MVADVEQEPCAEELRLWGGEAMLINPSECLVPAPPSSDLPSPPPFSRLGVALDW